MMGISSLAVMANSLMLQFEGGSARQPTGLSNEHRQQQAVEQAESKAVAQRLEQQQQPMAGDEAGAAANLV